MLADTTRGTKGSPIQIVVLLEVIDSEGVVPTVTTFSALHSPVYDTKAVPAECPVATPLLLIVRTAVFELLHVPDGIFAVNAIVEPVHTKSGPSMTVG
jgi:hypothetical protein